MRLRRNGRAKKKIESLIGEECSHARELQDPRPRQKSSTWGVGFYA